MNFGPMEIMVILVVALVLFGPSKLPELGKSLGKGIREFKRGTQGLKDELEMSLKDEPQGAGTAPAPQVAPQTQQVVYAAAPQPVATASTPAPTSEAAPAPVAPLRAADLAAVPAAPMPAPTPAPAPTPEEAPHRA